MVKLGSDVAAFVSFRPLKRSFWKLLHCPALLPAVLYKVYTNEGTRQQHSTFVDSGAPPGNP